MKEKKMKKLEKLEKYVIIPNTRFYGGFVFDGEDIYLCNDHDSIHDENGKEVFNIQIRQIIEDSILYTDIISNTIRRNGKKVHQEEHQELEIEKGQKLVYVENRGFTISEYNMVTIDEAKKLYDLLRSEKNETEGNEE